MLDTCDICNKKLLLIKIKVRKDAYMQDIPLKVIKEIEEGRFYNICKECVIKYFDAFSKAR